MRHLIISLALVLGSTSAIADSTSQDIADQNPVGLAFMVLDDNTNSIEASDPVYQWIMGRLQKEFKRADFMVFNAAVPTAQLPDSSLGLTAVKETLSMIDNPHVNSVVLVNALVSPELDDEVTVSINLRLFDVESESVYQKLNVTSSLQLESDCDKNCQKHSINRSLLVLSRSLTPETVASIQSEYSVPNQMLEQLVAQVH